jgi:hypothetical protein
MGVVEGKYDCTHEGSARAAADPPRGLSARQRKRNSNQQQNAEQMPARFALAIHLIVSFHEARSGQEPKLG